MHRWRTRRSVAGEVPYLFVSSFTERRSGPRVIAPSSRSRVNCFSRGSRGEETGSAASEGRGITETRYAPWSLPCAFSRPTAFHMVTEDTPARAARAVILQAPASLSCAISCCKNSSAFRIAAGGLFGMAFSGDRGMGSIRCECRDPLNAHESLAGLTRQN